MAFVVPVSQVAPLFVSCDVVAFPKTCNPLHVFTLASSVDEAAVTVIFAVPSKETPLIVRVVSSAVAVDALPTKAAFTVVNHAVVPDNNVVVAFPKVLSPVHVFEFANNVEDAAVTVMLPPAERAVPLMVPNVPVNNPAPIVVVDTTRPFTSVASNAEASEEICKLVVVAFVAESEPNALRPVHVFEFANNVVEATVIFAVPSKETPLIVRAVSSAVAVDALPTRAAFNAVNHAVAPA